LEDGGTIRQATRLFDSGRGVTREMRSKEEDHDYRYFPDPDLLPLVLDQAWVDAIAATLPELPDAKKARFVAELGLSAYDAGVLVAEREVADYFETVARGRDPKAAANWVTGELFAALRRAGLEIARSPLAAASLGRLLDLVADGTISRRIAREVFEVMFESGAEAARIVAERGLTQVTDPDAIEGVVDQVLSQHPERVAEYRGGKEKLLGFFVGQVMKATGGKANPKLVNEALEAKLRR
ncbi:MAG: Asp-tRNA(Asn)/Glu-tRNA(Gln) amidotransferase GatCAB subunit B, partial [Alphaproteobacteria bacterium]